MNKTKKEHLIALRVEDKMLKAINEVAEINAVSASSVIRSAINEYFKDINEWEGVENE